MTRRLRIPPRRRPGLSLAVAALAVPAALVALVATAAAAEATADGTYYPTGVPGPDMAPAGLSVVALVRVGLLLILAAAVFYATHWVFKDTQFVGTDRPAWSGGVLAAGLVGWAVALLVPWLAVGYPLGVVVFAAVSLVYVAHRNARVTAPLRVLTGAHWTRLRTRSPKGDWATMGTAQPDVTFLGYDDIPRRPDAASFEQQRANLEVQRLVREAIDRGASVLGIIARPQKGAVRYRVSGEMTAGGEMDVALTGHIVRTVKRLAGLNPDEARKPQEGRLQAVADGRNYDLRVQTAGTVRGEQVAIRIRDQAATQLRLEDLGLSEEQVVALQDALGQRPGLVLLSGPKDTGLTTTLHACLRHLDRYVNTVVAFEPHIDIKVENVEHVAVDQEDSVVAAAEVRSRLHMEPDVVVADALYDPDVALALAEAGDQAALVLGIRAGDTSQALAHLGQLLGSTDLLGRHLQVVTNQRLVRLLCPQCKQAYRPNPEFLRKTNLAAHSVDVLYRPPARTDARNSRADVCPRCRNHRYVGRQGLFELIPIDAEARDLIARGALSDLRTHCRKRGLRNLQEEGLRLILDGRTSVEEVLRAIKTD